MHRLNNKICLITGASSGIGEGIAELFHKENAIVILSDIDDEAGIALCKKLKDRAEYLHLDVSLESDWVKVFRHIKQKYGRLDVLINNAGIGGLSETQGPHDPEHFNLESWRKVQAINSDGVALGCKYAIQLMKINHQGSIINMSSRSGLVGIPGMAAYAASKASIRNHSKSVALYCAQNKYNIRCNSIHPGAILTPMWTPMLGDDKERAIKELSAQIPIGRMGTPMDVAYAALYLASDESTYVTGIELNIDGGILAGSMAAPGKRE